MAEISLSVETAIGTPPAPWRTGAGKAPIAGRAAFSHNTATAFSDCPDPGGGTLDATALKERSHFTSHGSAFA
jgi:hypothetical protein